MSLLSLFEIFRKPLDDTSTCMNCIISTSILSLVSPLSTLPTLTYFHNRIKSLAKWSWQGKLLSYFYLLTSANLLFWTELVFYLLAGFLKFCILFFCRQYREYLENLLEYLIYFFQRTEPLQDIDRIFSKVCPHMLSLYYLESVSPLTESQKVTD